MAATIHTHSPPPSNNDALFVQNTNAYYHDISFVYSNSLGEWVQLSATTNFTFGNGLNLSSNLVTLGALTADWNQTGNYAISTAGDINLNSGNLNTATTSASIFNSNATTLNIGGGAHLINLGAAGAIIQGPGALSLVSGTSSNLDLDSGTTGAVNIGTSNNSKTINIGTGNASNIINLGTSNVGTDTIAIGSVGDDFSLTSTGLNVSSNGALSGISALNGATFSSTTFTFANNGNIYSSGANALTLDSSTTGAVNLGTGNYAKIISIGTGDAGDTIRIGTDNTIADTISIGSALDAFTLSSSGLNISSSGALSGVTAINGASISSSTITFAASGTILTTGANALTLDSGTTGAVNIATGNNAKTVNIATNNMGNVINIGTNNTIADTIAIGSSLDALTISSSGFNADVFGALSGVTALNTITTSPTALSFVATGTIMSGGAYPLTLDSATNGAIDIGKNGHAKTITIGNSIGTSSVIIDAGLGNIDIGTTAIARTVNIGTSAGAAQLINIGGTGANTIAIGNTQTGGSIALGQAMTTGNISIGGTGAQTGNIDIGIGTGAQTINLGTGDTGDKTINIGTGNAATNTINIGTNPAGVDVISIGTAADQFALQSAGLNVSTLGALTGVTSIDSIVFSSSTIGFGATSTITSAGSNALTLDSGTTGALNIGTGNNAKSITIGNSTGGTALALLAGTGNIDIGANAIAHTITIGGAANNTIAIGNTQTGGSIALGQAMTTGSISIGGTGAQTGNIDIGIGTGAQTLNLGTGDTGNKTINIGTGNAATNTINIGTNPAGVDVISIGTAADQFTLQSAGLNVSTLGALTGVASLNTIALDPTRLTFAGQGTITTSAANTLTIDTGTTGTLNLGTGDHAKTIDIGTGNAGNILNIATNDTATDTISIGSSKDIFTLSSSGLNISALGALTGVSSLNGITLSSTNLTFSSTGTINTTGPNALYIDSGTTGSVNLGTGNDSKHINIGTGIGGDTINIGTDNTTQDIIAIGSPLDAFSITSNGFNVTTAGAISGFTTLNTITLAPTAITFAATGSVKSSGANALTIDTGTTGTLNLGTGNNAKTINLGTGIGGDTINIGTSNTVADAINIGSALDGLSLSSTGLNVSTTGSLTGVSSINTINVTSGSITFPAAGAIDSFDGFPLTLDSGTTGAVNLGTGSFAKTITIGNGTGTSSLALLAGAGNIDIGANAVARTINIGTAAGVPEIINVGGTGANTIGIGNTQTAGSVNIGNAMTTGAITIGGTGAQTGDIDIGIGTGAQNINLGTGGTGAKTVNIGTGAVANTVTIGNTTANTRINITAPAGGLYLTGLRAAAASNNVVCINNTTKQLYIGGSNNNCNTSSLRFKHDISDIALGLDAVMAMHPVSYAYNSDNSKALGFIAEEAANVDERLILRDEEGLPYAIHSDYFIPIITKGLQELNNKFDHFITQSGISMDALDQLALSGGLHVEGPIELGKDSGGEAVIRKGADTITITFDKPYVMMPIVTITKMSRGHLDDYYINNVTRSGFSITISPAQQKDTEFSWHAFGSINGVRVFSDGLVEDINATTTSALIDTETNQVFETANNATPMGSLEIIATPAMDASTTTTSSSTATDTAPVSATPVETISSSATTTSDTTIASPVNSTSTASTASDTTTPAPITEEASRTITPAPVETVPPPATTPIVDPITTESTTSTTAP